MEEISVKEPKQWAAGLPAVAVSMKQVVGRDGMVRGARGLLAMNQMGGFDCPSCAWPDPDGGRAAAEFCENGAKALASEAMRQTIGREFFAQHSVAELAEQEDAWHDRQGRLAEPMILEEGATHYVPVSWEEAFDVLAEELKRLESPDEAIFYTSGRASNEAAFLYQLFARAFGTNNLPDCSNMCHESSGTALKQAIGVGKGTVTLDDFLEAEVVVCVGQNPGTNHPRMLGTLQEAVKKGTRLVAVNPLKEAGLQGFAHPQTVAGMMGWATRLASTYLQVRVNGDMALFRGVAKCLAAEESFVAAHTQGYEAYRAVVDATPWPRIEALSGISRREIHEFAELLASGERKVITCWAMGLTQHRNAVATIREVVNVHLMLGAIGRPGAGLCPVRGHSNVQGDRTVGIWERMPEGFLSALDQWSGLVSPRKQGHDTVDSILAMHRGEAKVFFGLGGNFAQATPDRAFTAEALRRCRLTCHVSTKLNRSHLVHGRRALILPCLGRSDDDGGRWVSCENSMGVVQMSQGKLPPMSKSMLSEPEIVARAAEAVVGDVGRIRWRWLAEDYDRIRDGIEAVVPGFESYNQRVVVPGGFYLPNAAKQRVWDTASGKAEFAAAELDAFDPGEGRLILQTLRSHDQFNTTVYGMDDRYRGISHGRRMVLVNPDDLKVRGIRPMQPVRVTNDEGGRRRCLEGFLAVPYEMPRGMAAAYFPEANELVPVGSVARESNTPTSKAVAVEIEGM
ncbi:molybdopterin-dependent oxidoreductase alpha subunit [Haloferula luteola]|uniref:Molybdopterin-dependent oxidoreductase alpha subunit n=1 Tax=Haloferula luteola TaxID=595692 RepID=A0A840VG19_9BACT|nr:FdhF/YdeP family oxidoreductase [Haloferula luteola]MBB5352770.1 molybdopterin-dependent oxidoreductase alpha subunit [Haloferula luteola]